MVICLDYYSAWDLKNLKNNQGSAPSFGFLEKNHWNIKTVGRKCIKY